MGTLFPLSLLGTPRDRAASIALASTVASAVDRESLRFQSPTPVAASWMGRMNVLVTLLLVLIGCIGSVAPVRAQPPGTMPPAELLRSETPWSGPLKGIRPEAFLFQDESNTPVVMPRMSFEEIDRLRKRDRGVPTNEQNAVLERLAFDGTVRSSRGEFTADLLIRLDTAAIEQAAKPWVEIDLGFEGSNLLEPAEIDWHDFNASDAAQSGTPTRNPNGEQQEAVDEDGGKDGDEEKEDDEVGVDSEDGTQTQREDPAMVRSPDPLTRAYVRLTTTGGYRLVMPAEAAKQNPVGLITVRMKFSHRVEAVSQRQGSIRLKLPTVSTQMEIEFSEPAAKSESPLGDANQPDRLSLNASAGQSRPPSAFVTSALLASLEVSGNGREVVRRVAGTDRFVVECSGGDLTLDWATTQPSADNSNNLLEVESETTVQWESPTEPLTMEVRLSPRNLRGPLTAFDVTLPVGSVLLSPPEMNAEASASNRVGPSMWEMEVTPNNGESQSQPRSQTIRVLWTGDAVAPPDTGQLRLKIRQIAADANARTPWTMSVPQVVGAIGHRGLVTIRTSDDHRLRWRPRLGIDAVITQPTDDKNGQLSYPFRFSQNRFELPIWLSSKQEQLRLTTNVQLEVTRKAAQVSMEIVAGGSGIDPKGLRLELGNWRLLDIRASVPGVNGISAVPATSTRRDSELDIAVNDQVVQWQVDTADGKWPSSYRITAELPAELTGELAAQSNRESIGETIGETAGEFITPGSLTLPRLVSTDPVTMMSEVNLSLADGRRETWLVDLSSSPLLQRVEDSTGAQFRLIAPESPWTLQGEFASRPLELQWTGNARLSQSSDQWQTTSSWTVSSSLDLEGRLTFTMPATSNPFLPTQEGLPPGTPETPSRGTMGASDVSADATPSENSTMASRSTAGVGSGTSSSPTSQSANNLNRFMPSPWTVTVNGSPAVVRPFRAVNSNAAGNRVQPKGGLPSIADAAFQARQEWEIVSPELATGTHQIELVHRQPVLASVVSSDLASGDPRSSVTSVSSPASTTADSSGSVASLLSFPTPLAERVTLKTPMQIEVPTGVIDANGRLWRVSPDLDGMLGNLLNADEFNFDSSGNDEKESSRPTASIRSRNWSLKVLPDFPIPVVLRSRIGEESQTEIPRSYLRSLIGKQFRHEHLLASVKNGRRVRLGLPPSVKTIRVEVRFDGQPISATRDQLGLRIDLPTTIPFGSRATGTMPAMPSHHLLDVRIWTEIEGNPWYSRIEPMIRLPVGSGMQYWQLIVPSDSHLFWASSQSGRAMRWQHDRLRMERVAAVSDPELIRWAADSDFDFTEPIETQDGDASNADEEDIEGNPSATADRLGDQLTRKMIRESLSESSLAVPGNRYLFFAGNSLSFSAMTVSRTMLWLIVGGLVLMLAIGFEWFPSVHHPMVAFGLAIALAGMMVVAPDGVILTAQLAMISLSLVAVFYAISAIAVPRNQQRVLTNRNGRGNGARSRPSGSQSGVQRTSDWNRRGEGRDVNPPIGIDARRGDSVSREVPAKAIRPAESRASASMGTTQEFAPDRPTGLAAVEESSSPSLVSPGRTPEPTTKPKTTPTPTRKESAGQGESGQGESGQGESGQQLSAQPNPGPEPTSGQNGEQPLPDSDESPDESLRDPLGDSLRYPSTDPPGETSPSSETSGSDRPGVPR